MNMLVTVMFIFLYFEDALAIDIINSHKLNRSLQIRTSNGIVQGSEKISFIGDTYFSFLGIPFARPPINDLRFRSPKEMYNWSGVLDATAPKACCAGLDISSNGPLQISSVGNEDCLYLNVFTPQNPNEIGIKKPLAVFVFFHGGAFVGSCYNDYGPDYLMHYNVVYVVPAYRLSIYGFLSTQDLNCPGNWGSKDNIAALKWVKKNIHNFGGDPQKVTIAGQSAGAVLVNVLLITPKARGLFHKAVLMSGSSLSYWGHQTHQRKIAFDLGLVLGIETNSSEILMEKLRRMDGDALMKAQASVLLVNIILIMTNGLPFTPTLEPLHDEALITDFAYNLLENGLFNKVPVMAGVTSLEAWTLKPIIDLIRPAILLFDISPGSIVRITKQPQNRRIVGQKIKQYFLKTRTFLDATQLQLYNFLSEDAFWRPMQKMVKLLAKHTDVYFYEFAYRGQVGLDILRMYFGPAANTKHNFGVGHAEDIAYLFSDGQKLPNKDDINMSLKFTKLFANFIKSGNPTPRKDDFLDNALWSKAALNQLPFMYIDANISFSNDTFKKKSYKFWSSLYSHYADKPYMVY